jgi:glutamate/tyrosine decarboxylase-like PLP-dependent enzyme
MGDRVQQSPYLTLAAPVRSSICCFTAAPPTLTGPEQDALNVDIAKNLQTSGEAVFSTTAIAGRTVLRAALVNHRTTERDVDFAIEAVERARHTLLR